MRNGKIAEEALNTDSKPRVRGAWLDKTPKKLRVLQKKGIPEGRELLRCWGEQSSWTKPSEEGPGQYTRKRARTIIKKGKLIYGSAASTNCRS